MKRIAIALGGVIAIAAAKASMTATIVIALLGCLAIVFYYRMAILDAAIGLGARIVSIKRKSSAVFSRKIDNLSDRIEDKIKERAAGPKRQDITVMTYLEKTAGAVRRPASFLGRLFMSFFVYMVVMYGVIEVVRALQ